MFQASTLHQRILPTHSTLTQRDIRCLYTYNVYVILIEIKTMFEKANPVHMRK